MLKSVLNATGIPQNIERVKSELEQTASVQKHYFKAAAGHVAAASIWGAIGAVSGLFAIGTGLFLLYALLVPYLGPAGALFVLFLALIVVAVVGVMIAKGKFADIPKQPELKMPELFKQMPAVASPVRPDPVYSGSFASAPLSRWLFGVARDAAPGMLVGNPQIAQLISGFRPEAERAADAVMSNITDRLRYGDRKTMVAILGAAAFTGWLASRAARDKL